jgi:hypothetical protein
MIAALKRIRIAIVLWIYHRVPSCEEEIRLASVRMERSLTFTEWIGFRVHLLICLWCRRYLKQVELLHDAAGHLHEHLNGQDPSPEPGLSPEARERMRRLLSTEGGSRDS